MVRNYTIGKWLDGYIDRLGNQRNYACSKDVSYYLAAVVQYACEDFKWVSFQEQPWKGIDNRWYLEAWICDEVRMEYDV